MMNLTGVAAIAVGALLAVLAVRNLAGKSRTEPDRACRLWWRALQPVRATIYQDSLAEPESRFAMFSVALNDALTVRYEDPRLAARLAGMSADLLGKFHMALEALVVVMTQCSRSLHQLPQVRPLAVQNFRSPTAVGLVRRQALLHAILLSSRMRFFSKLHAIRTATNRLVEEYERAAEGVLVSGSGMRAGWEVLDRVQYDLNTLWQETQIVLKSLLHFTPDEIAGLLPVQFRAELQRLEAQSRPVLRPSSSRILG